MTKPILFLDVDGVLNCFQDENGEQLRVPFSSPFDLSADTSADMPVCVPRGMKERIKSLSENFDIVWCTAWMGTAHNAFKEHLELPDESWPYVMWNQHKLTEILKYAEGRPWVWVDDDIQFELDQLGWDRDRMIPDNALLKDINPNVGLTDQDVHDINFWRKMIGC